MNLGSHHGTLKKLKMAPPGLRNRSSDRCVCYTFVDFNLFFGEEWMEELRSFLASIVEGSDDAIIGLTPEGRIVSWNSGAQIIYGYRKEQMVGHLFSELLLPERYDEMTGIHKRIQRGERVKHFQTMHLRQDGQVISVSLSVSPVMDAFGRIIGASAISRDITRNIHTAEALREAEEMYKLLFSAGTDAIILFDADQQSIVHFNEAALKLYGYSKKEFSLLKWKDLNLAPRLGEKEIRLSLKEVPLAWHKRKDGTTFEAEMSANVFYWKGRRMLVGIVRDITERKRLQEIEHSLALANEIQQHLLPRETPQIEGYDIFAKSFYCQMVGGDYFDFLDQQLHPNGTLGFVVGDVSGHGVAAGLVMAMIRGVLRTEVEHYHSVLDVLFQKLNHCLLRDTEDTVFMTLFFGVLDTNARSLQWDSAGHGPVFWYQARQRRISELLATGIPLGIKKKADYPIASPIILEPGDILLIGTDGLWEAKNSKEEMYGTARLTQVMATLAEKSSRDICHTIVNKVRNFCLGELQDDMTLMVIKVLE